jgi:phosphonate degradation associated HDIG domain protein
MALALEDIAALFETRGAGMYGSESVSQLEHALQCAQLAEHWGAQPELVTACLLHDVGHLLAERPHEIDNDTDDVHQYIPIPFLRGVFPDSVIEPIRLHVDAKRYLCGTQPGYWETLSPASKHSLELQGGRYSAQEAQAFLDRPHASEAVLLRRWDDLAKTPGLPTPPLSHYIRLMRDCML